MSVLLGSALPVDTSIDPAHEPSMPATIEQEIRAHNRWRRKNNYYYAELERLFRTHIPPGSSVLEVGCGLGDQLAALQPSRAVGITSNARHAEVAAMRFPHIEFVHNAYDTFERHDDFDFVIVNNALTEMRDVQATFERIRNVCGRRTRVVILYFNALWEPILRLASKLGMRRKLPAANWLSRSDVRNMLDLTDFEVVRASTEVLAPKYIPVLSTLLNRVVSRIWPIKRLPLMNLFVARPRMAPDNAAKLTCSVIVPTHNERGNIQGVIDRTPEMGGGTEIVFVDGESDDGTAEEIQRQIEIHPERNMRFIRQGGRHGKGDAVRKGFEAATGDVLMILDADLTVAPEDMPKFYNVIASGRGEFVNGTRLVYPLAEQSMRFLNKCANRTFSAIFTWLLDQRFCDTLCGTKVLLREDYKRLIEPRRPELGRFDPFGDFDLIFGAARSNMKIIEIPVRYAARSYGETSIHRFRDGLQLLRMVWIALCRIKLR